MALPKKGLRKIVVDNVQYAWNASGNDDWIHLSIVVMDHQNYLVTAGFGYHPKEVKVIIYQDGTRSAGSKQQLIVTGYIVRQVILYALEKGWGPSGNITVLNLGKMDDKIDLRIGDE